MKTVTPRGCRQSDPWWKDVFFWLEEAAIQLVVLICRVYRWVLDGLTMHCRRRPRVMAWVIVILAILALWGWWPRSTPADTPQSTAVISGPVDEGQPKIDLTQKLALANKSAKQAKPWKAKVVATKVVIPKVKQPSMPMMHTKKGPLNGLLVLLDAGHGGKTPWGIDIGCHWTFLGQRFTETAYCQRMVAELAKRILNLGGDVAILTWSETMYVKTDPQIAMPDPLRTLLPGGQILPNGEEGLLARVSASNQIFRAYAVKHPRARAAFISMHVDAEAQGFKGLHVIYRGEKPRLAELVGQSMVEHDYSWSYKGNERDVLQNKSLVVLGPSNCLRQKILIETGIPGDDGDSWRLRNERNRLLMLERVVINPLKQWMGE